MNRAFARIAAASAIFLSGCATADEFPSLARRPAEGSVSPDPAICPADGEILALAEEQPGRISGSAEPAPAISAPPPATVASRDLSTRLAQLVEQARAAHATFGTRQASAERAVAAGAGAAEGTEAWSVASVALSGLESARSEAVIALGELDQRYAELSVSDDATLLDVQAASAARDQVDAIVAEEDAVLSRLRGRLR